MEFFCSSSIVGDHNNIYRTCNKTRTCKAENVQQERQRSEHFRAPSDGGGEWRSFAGWKRRTDSHSAATFIHTLLLFWAEFLSQPAEQSQILLDKKGSRDL